MCKGVKTDIMPPLTSTQLSFVCKPNGRLDKRVHILRHENLDKYWNKFCEKHRLECGPLLKENVTSAKVEIEWTDKLRKIVYKRYKCDFVSFGYTIYQTIHSSHHPVVDSVTTTKRYLRRLIRLLLHILFYYIFPFSYINSYQQNLVYNNTSVLSAEAASRRI